MNAHDLQWMFRQENSKYLKQFCTTNIFNFPVEVIENNKCDFVPIIGEILRIHNDRSYYKQEFNGYKLFDVDLNTFLIENFVIKKIKCNGQTYVESKRDKKTISLFNFMILREEDYYKFSTVISNVVNEEYVREFTRSLLNKDNNEKKICLKYDLKLDYWYLLGKLNYKEITKDNPLVMYLNENKVMDLLYGLLDEANELRNIEKRNMLHKLSLIYMLDSSCLELSEELKRLVYEKFMQLDFLEGDGIKFQTNAIIRKILNNGDGGYKHAVTAKRLVES